MDLLNSVENNNKILDYIQSYVLIMTIILGNFIGPATRPKLIYDIYPGDSSTRIPDGLMIQALARKIKDEPTQWLISDTEARFHEGWGTGAFLSQAREQRIAKSKKLHDNPHYHALS